ncbi:MAG: hypothetical protein ABI615_10410 [Chthoniobacterales bacterium]
MPIPVINPITSVQGYLQHEPWRFQLFATNSPVSWTVSSEIPGTTFNTEFGYIDASGGATVPGTYTLGFNAINASGTSETLVVTFGIGAAAVSTDGGVDINWDIVTGLVSVPTGITGSLPSAGVAPSAQPTTPVLYWKALDDQMNYIRITKNGTALDLDAVSVKFTCKQFDTNSVVVQSDGFKKEGEGTGAVYIVHTLFDLAGVGEPLSDNESEEGTFFDALCELTLVQNNSLTADVGPATIRISSQNFIVRLVRNLAP